MTRKKSAIDLNEHRITVAILEDNATLVKGMKAELDKPDIVVCVTCDNVDHFLEQLKSCQPGIAIVDLRIWKDLDAGFTAIAKAKALSTDTQFIIYTFYDVIEKFHKGINLGVRAFVSKNIYEKPLDEVVRIVSSGGTYYGDLLPKYLDKVRESSIQFEAEGESSSASGKLSKKEMEVIALLDQGKTVEQIAAERFISVNTVKAHTKNIRGKLGAKTTAEAVRIYRLRKNSE
jgi:NarL family two-component system response regulator LiaR